MCDQTEVLYTSGDVVWVKLGPVWWPGQVQDYDLLPEEITSNLRKRPIAVVKFFQEDSFEYVKNLDHIYHYNCRKKEEFIKKGLDMVRSSNSREVPSNMKMFPEDIVMAEHITGGDPNILNNATFAPEQKSDYSDLFGSKKSAGKKIKSELKKERNSWNPRKHINTPLKSTRRSLPVLPSTIPRPITHPRFLTKALEGKSDHEIRIRCQISARRDFEEKSTIKTYNCHLCEFKTTRLNVIVLHNKSHSASFIEAQKSIRAKLKSREKDISPSISSFNDQTPKTVTSRGRVKSLPKKLMDYTDEPPAKVFREKSPNKPFTKEILEFPSKSMSSKSPSKSAKKVKDNSNKTHANKTPSNKTPIKRPLFGKRKTAKEKAELAAKQKEENEAMKETLLKDWDDDDLFQEEVELEQLKQALESTASSVECEDSNNSGAEDAVHLKSLEDSIAKGKVKPRDTTKSVSNSDIKAAKVFEFDDSEDSLPVTNFRLKNQREKFTDDKFKKPKPPKPKTILKSKASILSPSPGLRQEGDKETEEFNKAFNSLLEETSVPVLPEIPETSLSLCKTSDQISEQTSDISSSTDLVKRVSNADTADDKINDEELQQRKSDSEYISSDLKLECTSSDSEEQVSEPVMVSQNTEEIQLTGQKNLSQVSASNPRVEIDSDLLMTGVATTTSDDHKSLNIAPSGNETLILREDSSTTEITSTCDIAKSRIEETENKALDRDELTLKMECKNETNSLIKTNITDDVLGDSCFHIDNSSINLEEDSKIEKLEIDYAEKSNEPDILKNSEQVQETCTYPTSEKIIDKTEAEIIESGSLSNDNTKLGDNEDLQALVISNESIHQSSQTITTLNNSAMIQNAFHLESVEESIPISSVKKEIPDKHVIKQVSMEAGESKALHLTETPTTIQPASAESVLNVQLIMPGDTMSNSNTLGISSQPLVSNEVKLEMTQTDKAENQNLSQNLQDMELDINSMPVIIGGEDFVQPEQPKQSLVSIQPKYSDSIVISPKVAQSPNKSEGVIMHLGDASTSSPHLQPLVALPSKGVKSGSRSRSQKSTSKTIKLPAGTLKNLGALQKGGNQQVLILKTSSSGQDKSDKSTIQKPCSMFQHGNKILIVNNAQMSGQNKIKLNPQQQQLLTGGKLAPGTRVITSKVVATTTSQGTESPSKMSFSKSPSKPTQKLVISKGGLLSNASNSVIINRKLGNVQGTHTITTSKGQTLITHNLLNTKGGLILPSSSQNATSSAKTTAIITSQALTTNKSMFLSPITSKGGTIISGNQKLRIVSSKAPLSGTRLLVQNSQGKLKVDPQHKGQQVKLISGFRGQSSGNTILIHTSQGLIAKSISSSTATTAATQSSIRATQIGKTIMTTVPTQAKIKAPSQASAQQPQIVQQPITVQPSPIKKATAQKIKQNPNILQKSQRKSTPRAAKSTGNRLISPAVSLPEPIILSPAGSLPGVGQPTLVQGQLPQTSDGLVYLTVDETGNYRQVDNKSMISFEGNPEPSRTIFIPADSQTQDMSNIFLAIDDAGNIVNITQPSTNKTVTTENTEPTQDILAKALANTQVLQQETIIPDMDVSAALASSSIDTTILTSNSYSEQANYPAPSLSHSVLETSLTLNQPIMTPLEVPSAVSPNIGQISTIPSNFISSNLIAKQSRPSMPLLTEEALANQTGNEPVYLLDSSNNIIPATSGSRISFQLSLEDDKVIMTGTDSVGIPSTYQVVPGDLLTTQIVDPSTTPSDKSNTLQTFSILSQGDEDQSETPETVKRSVILREALESSQVNLKTEPFLSNVEEISQDHGQLDSFDSSQKDIEQEENLSLSGHHPEQLKDSFTSQEGMAQQAEEETHSLKRNLGEEQTVTSSSDLQIESKRMRIDER